MKGTVQKKENMAFTSMDTEIWNTGKIGLVDSRFSLEPNSRDPFEGVRSKEEIVGSCAKVDAQRLVTDMSLRYPEAMNALKVVGMHPDQREAQPNMYLQLLPSERAEVLKQTLKRLAKDGRESKLLDNERFDNAGLHCVVVGAGSEKIAFEMFDGLVDKEKRVRDTAILGLVHDANKRAEAHGKNLSLALSFIAANGTESDKELVTQVYAQLENTQRGLGNAIKDPYSDGAYKQFSSFLKTQGLSDEIIDYVLRAGEISGHGSFKLLVQPDPDSKNGYLLRTDMPEALIVHAVMIAFRLL